MKIASLLPALAGCFAAVSAHAISLDDIQLWTGSGTNRAAMVVEWSTPEVFSNTVVPAPLADKTLVWGYRFNGTATAGQMMRAIALSDPKLYVAGYVDPTYGAAVLGIGYNLNGNGLKAITDGSTTNYITNGFLANVSVNLDAAVAVNSGDLYWGASIGPGWELWNESGDTGGFLSSPNRGSNPYWTPDDTNNPYYGSHGQWDYAGNGLDFLPLTNGSWIGFSVAAASDDDYDFPDYPDTVAFNFDKHAPVSPDGTYVAYVGNTNDFAVQIVSTNNIYAGKPYNDPLAVLGPPTLKFHDGKSIHVTKIIEPPFSTDPSNNPVITEISAGGQITVNLGRKIYDDPANPYGIDLIVYGNSFYSASGFSGAVSDATDLDAAQLISGYGGHPTTVSVSQDGVTWFSYTNIPAIFPDDAYRWDETNHAWTAEQMNPTKPVNPYIYTNNLIGQSVASALDQFAGAAGGSGFDLKPSGMPWIQYVRLQTDTTGDYTVIDAVAAVNPVTVGDALTIAPDNLAYGSTHLLFQQPSDTSQNLITVNFDSISEVARLSTVSLNDFTSFAPVPGIVSSAYQFAVRPVIDNNAVTYVTDAGLRVGAGYAGNGHDLRLYQWCGTNWTSQPFIFDTTNSEVQIFGLTNLSAFVISQIVPPQMTIQTITNGFAFQFVPVPNCEEMLQRSTNLVAWSSVTTFTATSAQPVTLQDTNAPAGQAFYRLQMNP